MCTISSKDIGKCRSYNVIYLVTAYYSIYHVGTVRYKEERQTKYIMHGESNQYGLGIHWLWYAIIFEQKQKQMHKTRVFRIQATGFRLMFIRLLNCTQLDVRMFGVWVIGALTLM